MRRIALAVALLAAGLAGCLEGESGVERDIRVVDGSADPTETLGTGEYWMVWVRGNETDERTDQVTCARTAPDYRIERANTSVVYDNRSYDFDPDQVDVLVAFDHEDRTSSCPEAEHLRANPEPGYTEEMGEYGDLSMTVHDNGSMTVEGRHVPLGDAANVTYEGTPEARDKLRVDGWFTVEVLGDWPKEGLQAGQP